MSNAQTTTHFGPTGSDPGLAARIGRLAFQPLPHLGDVGASSTGIMHRHDRGYQTIMPCATVSAALSADPTSPLPKPRKVVVHTSAGERRVQVEVWQAAITCLTEMGKGTTCHAG